MKWKRIVVGFGASGFMAVRSHTCRKAERAAFPAIRRCGREIPAPERRPSRGDRPKASGSSFGERRAGLHATAGRSASRPTANMLLCGGEMIAGEFVDAAAAQVRQRRGAAVEQIGGRPCPIERSPSARPLASHVLSPSRSAFWITGTIKPSALWSTRPTSTVGNCTMASFWPMRLACGQSRRPGPAPAAKKSCDARRIRSFSRCLDNSVPATAPSACIASLRR